MSERINPDVTAELREGIRGLHQVKTRIQRTRQSSGVYWHARSLGEPRMGEDNPLEHPTRIRFVESWLRGGQGNIGRVKIVVQHIFEGTSIFEGFGDLDEEGSATGFILQSDNKSNAGSLLLDIIRPDQVESFRSDVAISHTYRMRFMSSGEMCGTLMRRTSHESPYIVGLDDGVPDGVLQAYGAYVNRQALDYVNGYHQEAITSYSAQELGAVLRHFAVVEQARIAHREEHEGAVYYE